MEFEQAHRSQDVVHFHLQDIPLFLSCQFLHLLPHPAPRNYWFCLPLDFTHMEHTVCPLCVWLLFPGMMFLRFF